MNLLLKIGYDHFSDSSFEFGFEHSRIIMHVTFGTRDFHRLEKSQLKVVECEGLS